MTHVHDSIRHRRAMKPKWSPEPKMIPNPLWCERCQGFGYVVYDAELDPYPVECGDCKDRRRAKSANGG